MNIYIEYLITYH